METRLILGVATGSISGNKCINQPITWRNAHGD